MLHIDNISLDFGCMDPKGKTVAMSLEDKKEEKLTAEKTTKMVSFLKLFTFADTLDTFLMVFGTVGAVGNGLGIPLMTKLFGDAVDSFGQTENQSKHVDFATKIALGFVYLGVGTLMAAFLQVACWMISGERQAARIRRMYLKAILSQDVAFFDRETNTGEILGGISGDTVLIQDAMGEKVGKFLQLMSTFAGGFAIAFFKGWLLTLAILSFIPVLAMAVGAVAYVISKMALRGPQNVYAQAATVVEQTVGAIRTVASFTMENQVTSCYRKCLVTAYKSDVYQSFVTGLGLGIVFLVFFCSYGLGIWFGSKMILEKDYTGGEVLTVIVSVLAGSMSLGQASPCLSAFIDGRSAAYRMFETIARKPEIAYETNGMVLEDICGDIEMRNVYFSYPARPDEPIFQGFSLFIPSGKTTALVGPSGSGKSTVISLIERFYDPQAGQILIDGVNLKNFQLKWIRSQIGLVSQEPVLFTSTIRDNIAYGKDNATIEEIRAAAEIANAASFIDKLPQGLETRVGEHGTLLSGGQKQRIALSRAILKDPRILLLDEATSALDTESERIVQEALDRIMAKRTTVVVAHRLSTVRNAETIAVIQLGNIAEKGSHSELLRDPNGVYSQLVRLQEVNKECGHFAADHVRSDILVGSCQCPNLGSLLRQSTLQTPSVGKNSRSSKLSMFGLFARLNMAGTDVHKQVPSQLQERPHVSILRLAALNKPETPVLLLGVLAAMANGLIFPIFGFSASCVIQTLYEPPHKLRKDSSFWAIMYVVLGIGSLLVYPAQTYLFSVAGCKLVQRVRLICFDKVVHMGVSWFDEPEHSSGAIGARLSVDAAAIRSLVGDALAQMVQNISSAVAALIIALAASWQLALIVVVLLPLLALNAFAQMKFMKGFSADAEVMYEEASQVASDAVQSIRTIASFCAEDKVLQMYEEKCDYPIQTGIRRGLVSGIGFGISFFVLFASYATCFYTGGHLVKEGKATFSQFFQVFFALTITAIGISQSSSFSVNSSKAKRAAASVFAIIDEKSKIDPNDESGMVLQDVKGDIELRNISFRYPARPDVQIFQDLSLSIPAGKTVALVGESGSGKSTVISLLQRFYDPDSGHIGLDGVEIHMLQLKWLRQQMGLVSQEPVLFNDTIRANITYGKTGNATEAEIITASKLVNAHNFISSLQKGYDTMVGERGIQLSGGQKQRVAIARAIIKNPKILLLDEATSALDAESESLVQEALDRVMVKRTTVVVAHRLSTIKNADTIAVFKNGSIIEKGKHESLININNGFYASLVQNSI